MGLAYGRRRPGCPGCPRSAAPSCHLGLGYKEKARVSPSSPIVSFRTDPCHRCKCEAGGRYRYRRRHALGQHDPRKGRSIGSCSAVSEHRLLGNPNISPPPYVRLQLHHSHATGVAKCSDEEPLGRRVAWDPHTRRTCSCRSRPRRAGHACPTRSSWSCTRRRCASGGR
eukprot:194995-Chlamydomonas_euryale.AAC.3